VTIYLLCNAAAFQYPRSRSIYHLNSYIKNICNLRSTSQKRGVLMGGMVRRDVSRMEEKSKDQQEEQTKWLTTDDTDGEEKMCTEELTQQLVTCRRPTNLEHKATRVSRLN